MNVNSSGLDLFLRTWWVGLRSYLSRPGSSPKTDKDFGRAYKPLTSIDIYLFYFFTRVRANIHASFIHYQTYTEIGFCVHIDSL